jgi:hypothetical protein
MACNSVDYVSYFLQICRNTHKQPSLKTLTLALSRANSRSEGRAEAVGVGCSGLFGSDYPSDLE